MKKTNATGVAALALLLFASPVSAQESLADAVSFLMTNRAVQTGDFASDQTAAEAARDAVSRALLVNVTNAPFGTSSGGFLYRLNPELGTVERASANFGGFFVERALLAGAGTASFGFTASAANYNQLDGHDLKDGTFVTTANKFRSDAAPFDTSMTLADAVGKDRASIANHLRLLRLPPDVQRQVSAGVLSMGQARALVALENPVTLKKAADDVVARALSVRETEALVRRLNAPPAPPAVALKDVHTREAEDVMKLALGTRVRIVRKGKGGKVEIDFVSEDELNRIYEHITDTR